MFSDANSKLIQKVNNFIQLLSETYLNQYYTEPYMLLICSKYLVYEFIFPDLICITV